MSDERSFQEKVEQIVTAASSERAGRQQALSTEMTARDASATAFARAAERAQQEVIRPRVEVIARHFPNARVEELSTPAGLHVRCVFARSDQYPASVTLTAGILHDRDRAVASAFYRVEIVPLLGEFQQGAHHDVAIDALARGEADAGIAAFLDDALLGFVQSYLHLEVDPRYQGGATTRDPVCGMSIAAADASASADHTHHRYYFCSMSCRDKFVANPVDYVGTAATLRG